MEPSSAPPPGNPAGGPPAPPLCPHSFNLLLGRHPDRAAAILAAMRPPQRRAQARAHADLCAVPVARILSEWDDLMARAGYPTPPTTPDSGAVGAARAVYDPALLADLLVVQPDFAHAALAELAPLQRLIQAAAQAAWLQAFGYRVAADDILTAWSHDLRRII